VWRRFKNLTQKNAKWYINKHWCFKTECFWDE
jgi:hypothetical protein